MLLDLQLLLSSIFIFSTYYVYCYAPIYQSKCENLLGNKPDSDSDSDSE